MRKLLLLAIILIYSSGFSQGLTLPQWKKLEKYSHIPMDRLQQATIALDSTIAPETCYKFLHNADTTRFVAFFLQRIDEPNYEQLKRHGRTVYSYYGKNEYLGYTLWAIKYNDALYFDKNDETEFNTTGKDITDAKNDYLVRILTDHKYFNKGNGFWEGKGGNPFEVVTKAGKNYGHHIGNPRIVNSFMGFTEKIRKIKVSEVTDAFACNLHNELWSQLESQDNNMYYDRYFDKISGRKCYMLYDTHGNRILLLYLHMSKNKKPHLSYYFAVRNCNNTTLYKWKKIPRRELAFIKDGDLKSYIIDDMRQFIPNWVWGTKNMIENEAFWNDNFTEADLEPVK